MSERELIAEEILTVIDKALYLINVNERLAYRFDQIIYIFIIFLLSWLLQNIITKTLVSIITRLCKYNRLNWMKVLIEKNVSSKIAQIIPPVILLILIPFAFRQTSIWLTVINKILLVYAIIATTRFIISFSRASIILYYHQKNVKETISKGVLQLITIIYYTLAVIVIIAVLLNKTPYTLLTGIGAFAAFIVLIFKDTILGFVAGLQLSANDMLRLGDWIEMPKYGANGVVVEVTLNTVKVQNFDNTLIMVPPYAMITDYFQNWRGMSDSGARRITRNFFIDVSSIKVTTPELLEKYKKIPYIVDFIENFKTENTDDKKNIMFTSPIIGSIDTNIGLFRAYLCHYLFNYHYLQKDMMFMIRSLDPTNAGLPLQLYFFTNTTDWLTYEAIRTEVTEHLIAMIGMFDLVLYQLPSGKNIESILPKNYPIIQ